MHKGNKFTKSQEKINYLMNMDKNEKELETLIQTIRIYSLDIGMEFYIVKWAMLIIKSGKRQITEGIEQPNQQRIRMLREKKTYLYLGILEAGTIHQVAMKEKKF